MAIIIARLDLRRRDTPAVRPWSGEHKAMRMLLGHDQFPTYYGPEIRVERALKPVAVVRSAITT